MESFSIKTWAEEDRPREKLLLKGKSTLSNAELIAILISSGNSDESAVDLSKRILLSVQNDLNSLGKLSVAELSKFKGIGEAKAISIIAALELGRRRQSSEIIALPIISSSRDAYEYLQRYMSDLKHEEFFVLYLNKANRVTSCEQLSSGGVSGTVADLKMIFQLAVEKLACSIIVSHNHPSGSLKPSQADIDLTKKIKQAGMLLEISLFDHLIIGEKDYYSFADEGNL